MSDGPYKITLASSAQRTMARLPPRTLDPILAFIHGPLTENPLRATKPLHNEYADLRAGYVGISYRVLIRVNEQAIEVVVVKVGHRADVYR